MSLYIRNNIPNTIFNNGKHDIKIITHMQENASVNFIFVLKYGICFRAFFIEYAINIVNDTQNKIFK